MRPQCSAQFDIAWLAQPQFKAFDSRLSRARDVMRSGAWRRGSHAAAGNAQVNAQVADDVAVIETSLKLHQLSHEVEVWRHDAATALDVLERVHHGHAAVQHDVRHSDGRRA